MNTKIIFFYFLFIYIVSENTKNKVEDLFDGLYSYDIYSGYIETETPKNSLFYIYTPSQTNPDTDPLLLWLNGGPGCSSLIGFLTEIGPVISPLYSFEWKVNEYSWNKNLNVLYIESPAGVGFTKSIPDPVYDEEEKVAKSLRYALENFFPLFSELSGREFYIAGESYAGVYIPYLTMEILNSGSEINLKGILIGNPLTYFPTDAERSDVEFGYSHGIISKESFEDFENKCYHLPLEGIYNNNKNNNTINDNEIEPRNVSHKCNEIRQTISNCFQGLDNYGIYRPCPQGKYNNNRDKLSYKYSILHNLKNFKKQNKKNSNKKIKNEEEELEIDILQGYCDSDNAIDILLNNNTIKKKLAVNVEKNWTQCSNINYTLHESISFYEQFLPLHKDNIKVWIMSGDTDAVLPTLGTLRWIKHLNSSVSSDWEQYRDENNQVCGMKISYENGLTLITAKGAGHMIPQDKPKIAEIIKNLFIKS